MFNEAPSGVTQKREVSNERRAIRKVAKMDELVRRLRAYRGGDTQYRPLMDEAAEAIEELHDALYGYLHAVHPASQRASAVRARAALAKWGKT